MTTNSSPLLAARRIPPWLMGAVLTLVGFGPAAAADLQFAIFHPKTDAFAIAEDKWMDAVSKKTDGRVKFKPAYAGSLVTVSEAFDAVQSGTVEVALTAASFLSGKVPDVSPFEPLGAYPEGPRFSEMMKEVEPLLESIFTRHKVVYMWSQPASGVVNLCRGKHTKLPQDYKGMKIRAAGRWQAAQMRALGASPVAMDPGSQFQALQTGTIDCALSVNNLVLSFKLHEAARFLTQYGLPVNLSIVIMNPAAFERLSPEDRKIVREVSREVTATAVGPLTEAQAAAGVRLKEQGANIYVLSDAERKAFQDGTRPVYDEMAKTLGEQGKKVLDIMMRYR